MVNGCEGSAGSYSLFFCTAAPYALGLTLIFCVRQLDYVHLAIQGRGKFFILHRFAKFRNRSRSSGCIAPWILFERYAGKWSAAVLISQGSLRSGFHDPSAPLSVRPQGESRLFEISDIVPFVSSLIEFYDDILQCIGIPHIPRKHDIGQSRKSALITQAPHRHPRCNLTDYHGAAYV